MNTTADGGRWRCDAAQELKLKVHGEAPTFSVFCRYSSEFVQAFARLRESSVEPWALEKCTMAICCYFYINVLVKLLLDLSPALHFLMHGIVHPVTCKPGSSDREPRAH